MVSSLQALSFRLALLVFGFECVFSICSVGQAIGQNHTQLDFDPKYELRHADPKAMDADPGRFEEPSEEEKKAIAAHNKPIKVKIQEDKRKVESILESNGDINNPIFKEFFDGYVFPEMTRLGESNLNLANLGTQRAEFLKSYLSSKVTGQARNRFIDSICIPSLTSLSTKKDLHPAARLSAVYLLGALDSATGSRSPATPPVPSQAAFDELMKLMDSKDAEIFLKVGAMAGIQRHFEIDSVSQNVFPEPKRARVKALATEILSDKFAGQDQWNTDLNHWMKRRAAMITGLSKDAKSLDLLIGAMENKDYPLSVRLDAMEAIGNLGLPKAEESTIKSITRFLSESYQSEASWLSDQVDTLKYDNMLFEDLDLEVTGTNWSSTTPVASTGGGRSGGGAGGGRGMGGMGGGRGMGGMGGMGGGRGMDGGAGLGGGGLGGADEDEGGGRGGRGDMGGIEGGDDETGGRGAAGGGRGRSGGSGDGQGAPPTTQTNSKFVELPNFQLHVARTRIKTLASSGTKLLKPEVNKGLHKVADAQAKTIIDKVVTSLEKIRKDSNVGIKNLDPRANRTRPGNALDQDDGDKKEEEKSVTQQLSDFCSSTSVKLLEAIGEKPAEKEKPKEEAAKEEPIKDDAGQ